MTHWTKEQGREALATISTLKRVLGIPNHPTKRDSFVEDRDFQIYTPDQESAQLIGELLWRYGNGPKEAYYNAHPDLLTVRDTIRVRPLEEGGFAISINIPYAPSFAKALQKMVNKHIAPDKTFTR